MQWVTAIAHCAGGAGLGSAPLPAGRDERDAPMARAVKGRHRLMLVRLLLPRSKKAFQVGASMVKVPSLAGPSSPSQPPHMEAFGSRLLHTLWRSHGAAQLALKG